MQNTDMFKLKASLFVLDKIMDYDNAMAGCGGAFEHMDGKIENCSFCKIPFYIEEYEGWNLFCHNNMCEKKWCGRSEFCTTSELQKCLKCDEFICSDHMYQIGEETPLCRTCYWNKRPKYN
jgi:hypothetical protein